MTMDPTAVMRAIRQSALWLAVACAAHAVSTCVGGDEPAFHFVDVSAERGIGPYTMAFGKGASIAAADYDDDGDVDFFAPCAEGVPDQLYRNLGDGTFEEIAAAAGLDSLDRGRVALWFDYDGDHRLDLFVAGDCFGLDLQCTEVNTLKLYRQVADSIFLDVTEAAGIPDDIIFSTAPHRGGMAAGDIDGDGYLDLIFGLWSGPARVLLNQADGTFTDHGAASGIGPTYGHYWQPVMHDFDRDGFLDIYALVDFTGNHLWVNQGDATFIDRAGAAGADSAWNDMGVTLGDYDNDGDLDVYVTNITTTSRHNVLYRNDSVGVDLQFVDVSEETGAAEGGWGWGCCFFDADNDGRLDIATTNGWFDGIAASDPSRFYLNRGDVPEVFADVSTAVGFDDTYWGSALVAVDYDRDGDLDLLQSCNGNGTQPHLLRVLENRPVDGRSAGNHLVVKPRMTGPNHRAIGAVVRITVGATEMMRLIGAGTSFFGQEPAEAFFGLGDAERVDLVRVEWPDGRVSEITDVAANQVITVGPITFTDVTLTAGIGRPGVLTESVAWGDYDNDGDEDLYLTNDGPNRLFRNDGGDAFTDVTEIAGVGSARWSVGTGFADLDNDGDLDLYVVSFGEGSDVLYRNDGPVGKGGETAFTDVTVDAGTTFDGSSRGMAFVDYDRDGRLDIYVNAIGPDILYRNLGNLKFTNVADDLGTNPTGQGVGIVGTDVNGDGWIDLYTANRSGEPSNLFVNDGGAFTDVALDAGITAAGLGMGVLSFDYDNDLDMDLYWTTWPGADVPVPNRLYENTGDGSLFVDVAEATGTTDVSGWGISCNAGDVDNDGWEDFFVSNGFSANSGPSVLYRNLGGVAFEDVTSALDPGSGLADYDGRGVAFADYDGDGDLDVVLTGGTDDMTRLWRNDTANGNHWITLSLIGRSSNRSAVGARVEVTANGVRTVKEVSGGAGRGSFNSLPLEFGLGSAPAGTGTAFIRWPSGRPHLVEALATDRLHALTEPREGDRDDDGDVDLGDLMQILDDWGTCPEPPDYCLSDLDGDGRVGLTDLLAVLGNWS